MPRSGRIVWLAAAFGLAVGSTRAQDDLAPPPKSPTKSAPVTLPPDDLEAPPVPLKKPAAKPKKSEAAKETIDFPGVDLPSDPPSTKGKKATASKSESLSAPKTAPRRDFFMILPFNMVMPTSYRFKYCTPFVQSACDFF